MKKGWIILITVLLTVAIGLTIFFTLTPTGKAIINEWKYGLEKTDEKTYENQKEVEDTCRAMIASYTQDKLVYEQYKNSQNADEISWANNAKIRANNTAATYNNYILKYSYVWQGNVPSDIYMNLEYI
jgi:hypothetical protein